MSPNRYPFYFSVSTFIKLQNTFFNIVSKFQSTCTFKCNKLEIKKMQIEYRMINFLDVFYANLKIRYKIYKIKIISL